MMATATGDDTTNCPVCFEGYDDQMEGHVPRLLPCTHTVCQACVKCLLNRSSLTCPECRTKHPAENDVKSFPQNKYILANIRGKKIEESAERNDKKTTNNCKKHGKDLDFYCNEKTCRMVVCPLCMLHDHRSHDVVDVQQAKLTGDVQNINLSSHDTKDDAVTARNREVTGPPESTEDNLAALVHEVLGREYTRIPLTQPRSQQTLEIRTEGKILTLFKVKIS